MVGRLAVKTAFVTGAAQGIGRSIAGAFAREDAQVVAINLRWNAPLSSTSATTMRLDMTAADAVGGRRIRAARFRTLVNCVGHIDAGTVLEGSIATPGRSFAFTAQAMKAILPGMAGRGGAAIVNISSVVSSTKGVPHRYAYGSTKAAVIGLTDSSHATSPGMASASARSRRYRRSAHRSRRVSPRPATSRPRAPRSRSARRWAGSATAMRSPKPLCCSLLTRWVHDWHGYRHRRGDEPVGLAVVTAASPGIGRAIVPALARDGWHAAFTHVGDVSGPEEIAALAGQAGSASLFGACDAGSGPEVDAFRHAVADWADTPDLLVNNATIQTDAPLLDLSQHDLQPVIRTNLKGCSLNTQAAARAMRDARKGGAIVNKGSGRKKIAFPNLSNYAASQGRIDQSRRSAELELGPLGVRINCVASRAIMVERSGTEGAGLFRQLVPADADGPCQNPGRRRRRGALVSPAAEFVSGQTLMLRRHRRRQRKAAGIGSR